MKSKTNPTTKSNVVVATNNKNDDKKKSNNNNDQPTNHKKNGRRKITENTVFFRYSPSSSDSSITHKDFVTFFSDVGPVKKCSLIESTKNTATDNNMTSSSSREAKGYGFCKFTCQQDAMDAAKQLNKRKMKMEDGSKVTVWVEMANSHLESKQPEKDQRQKQSHLTKKKMNKQQQHKQLPIGTPSTDDTKTTEELYELNAKKRTSRVIVRNLSFYATEQNIRKVMQEQFGPVVDIHLPLVPNIDGIKKDQGKKQSQKQQQQQQHRGFAFVTFASKTSAQKAVNACANANTNGTADNASGVIIKKRPVAIDFSVSKVQHRRMIDGEKNMDDEEEDGDEEGEEEEENENDSDESDDDGSETSAEDVSDNDDDDDDDDDEESDDEESDSDEEMEDGKTTVDKNSYTCSLFLRNLPFDTTRHDIFTLFAKFGRIGGIYLVRDKNTGLAKGTAFVKYESDVGCTRALEASNIHHDNDENKFESGKNVIATMNSSSDSSGLFLRGRRILVNKAVDKDTAESLKVQRDEDGKPIDKKIGKDKRNLYLKGEGRVEEGGQDSADVNCWENIPESDQMKRGRAHQEKSTKLRSPLFFINPYRLSLRNLAKHVDEKQLKVLMATGIKNGLEKELVTKEDIIAHWRAGGEISAREIIEKLKAAEKKGDDGDIIPPFNESDGYKRYIPSVFIDRDFEVKDGKVSKHTAPSRGFGFAEFTHHAHALACLRELNNNTSYSADYVAGGKKAFTMRKHKNSRKKRKMDENVDESFVGEDGKVRIPRLIVEFTVENKAKARKQAERKAQQLDNALRQKADAKQRSEELNDKRKKKKSRGAQQRAKKRKLREQGLNQEANDNVEKKQKIIQNETIPEKKESTKNLKGIKPLKKKKVDKDESAFENMVKNYKIAFSAGNQDNDAIKKLANERAEITNKRWFD